MKIRCGCCEGVEVLTPARIWNRPGLSAIQYRVGTHGTFLESMQARLSGLYLDILTDQFDDQKRRITRRIYPLKDLKTRDASDPAIALLDAWATVGDVLTFYQERIANEGYLRTATERRSILELARLIGYKLRPGVSASVYLAYTLDEKSAPVEIPTGTRSQSVPGPGETPQFFETSEVLQARVEWNNLQPRLTRPQHITFQQAISDSAQTLRTDDILIIDKVFFEGIATNLSRGDSLLFIFGEETGQQVIRRVEKVSPDFAVNRTEVILQTVPAIRRIVAYLIGQTLQVLDNGLALDRFRDVVDQAMAFRSELAAIRQTILLGGSFSISNLRDFALNAEDTENEELQSVGAALAEALDKISLPDLPPIKTASTTFGALVTSLLKPQSLQPANRFLQSKSAGQVFKPTSDIHTQLLVNFQPVLADSLYTAWGNIAVHPSDTPPTEILPLIEVQALRATASLFGYNAPLKMVMRRNTDQDTSSQIPLIAEPGRDWDPPVETEATLYLDNVYKEILPESFIVIQTPEADRAVTPTLIRPFKVQTVDTVSRTAYSISAKTTRLDLYTHWWDTPTNRGKGLTMADIRSAIVYAQSEPLTLAEAPIFDDIAGNSIETGRLYDGLEAGRWVIVAGERTDIADTSGVRAVELVMLAGVEQKADPLLPGDKTHTALILENDLAYAYRRASVKIYGNVVKATNGETRNEVMGSGDATQAFQQFALKQPPLTYVSAPTVDGIESTLHVRVNDVEWHESDSLALLTSADRNYVTVTDDDAKTSVVFGDGKRGARPPTGLENITAVYRSGIGKGGNVKAEQITLPITKPLGVKEVINPLRASGGADKESRDMARRNAPLAVMALDRLVATEDYADFARTFAGIAKASATQLSDGHRLLVHLTIAGVDDIPIDVTSDLFQNLRRVLHQFGDPYQAVQIEVRELLALVLSATVHILPDYLEEKVEPKIRQALLDRFSFDQRELGQPAFLSEAISTIQRIEGVAYVDVDSFDSTSEAQVLAILAEKDEQAKATATGATNSSSSVSLPLGLKPYVNAGLASAERGIIKPAQLAFFLPNAPETLILNLIKEAAI